MRRTVMVRWNLFVALGVLLLAVATGAQADEKKAAAVGDLAWMAGSWLERKGGVETEEHWLPPKGDVMLGLNRTVRGPGKTAFEFLRIAKGPRGLTYFASPQGRPATEFPLAELGDKKVVFENPGHDFPQRISYWLEADGALHGRIEGTLRGTKRSQEWRWQKVQ